MRRKASARRVRAMRDIDQGLRMLSSGLRRLARDVSTMHVAGNGRAMVRRRPVTRALKLQGRYMGLIRTLPLRLKLQVKAIRAKQGVEQAIRKARALKD